MRRREVIVGMTASAAWPFAARAQNLPPTRRLAVLMSTDESDPQEKSSITALVDALAKRGWTTGQNLEIRYWWAAGEADRMIANARAAVSSAPDALLVKGANLPAVQQTNSKIPIVFVVLSDAVADRYVGSFARPIANITGFTSYERALVGKRLTILSEIAPQAKKVLYVRSRRVGTDTDALFQALVADAHPLNLTIVDGASDNAAEIERNVDRFARERAGSVMAAFDAFVMVHRDRLVELAARYRLPAIYPLPAFIKSGGLVSYGFDQDDQFRQAADYVARILEGEKPGDLPVQTPTKFKMVINLATAKSLGLTIPQSLVATADEVIE